MSAGKRQAERDAGGYPGINIDWTEAMITVAESHANLGTESRKIARILNTTFPNAIRPFTKEMVVGKLWRLRKARQRAAMKEIT